MQHFKGAVEMGDIQRWTKVLLKPNLPGWYVIDTFGHRNISHSGGYPNGFRNYIARYIDDDLTIIVLSNQMETDSKGLPRELASIVFGKGIWFWQKYI
ncbi:hypothetical protein [Lederbergia citrea]|uniref:Beta-lactamase-related domain-containing protein n=2 Tax=Lederbergia citrea TaxID=2833581 RepID=A0A942UN82_9BACI|nr:hypothetical protein [Lederbergia citrea]MBS4206096.1 hypothetical protein [Lederbergia citrea]MBS4224455.1 hypothetical protein [Lederbergia citrea]